MEKNDFAYISLLLYVKKYLNNFFATISVKKRQKFGKIFVRTIVFKINRLESALAMSKISFLRKFEKSYTCKRLFFGQTKKYVSIYC